MVIWAIKEVSYGVNHINLGTVITVWLESKLLDSVLIILISENKPLKPTNIVFFDFKLCL